MKKAMVVLVAMMLITLISVGSLSAAFVYPSGKVKLTNGLFDFYKDKATTTLYFKAQPDTVGAYDYTISAGLVAWTGWDIGSPNTKSGFGLLYPTLLTRTHVVEDKEYDASIARGIVYVFTTTNGELSAVYYD